MIKKYKSLNKYWKISIWTALVTIVLFCCFIPLFFFSWKEIPLGMLLGSGLSLIFTIIQAIGEKKEIDNKEHTLTMILIIARFLVTVGAIVGLGFLYYKANIKIFNLFAFVGGYTISKIVLVIFMIKDKE